MSIKKELSILVMLLCLLGLMMFLNSLSKDNPPEEPTQNQEVIQTAPEQEEKDEQIILFEDFIANLPEYTGEGYVVANDDKPFFSQDEIDMYYESEGDTFILSELDSLGRAGVAIVKITPESLCFEKRENSISELKPSGWHTVRYDDLIEDKYLFNRCHLIMRASYQNAANTDVLENLVTGTRYMNLNELETEERAVQYVEVSGHNLLYRATPIYNKDELVCRGILLEGYGHGTANRVFQFCRYYFNVQPGIKIDYATGESHAE